MIWFIIAGILLTIVIVAFLLVMSISLNVQIFFVSLSNKLFKSERLRKWVDTCNQQNLLFKGNGPNHYPRQDCAIAYLSMEYVETCILVCTSLFDSDLKTILK